jgi:hypothetical protein
MKTRRPHCATSEPILLRLPAPKMIRVAVANSKILFLSPPIVIGKDVCVFHAAAGLGHHVAYRIPPLLIMLGLPVPAVILRGSIHLQQHEPGRIVALLKEVEASDAGLTNAVGSIFQCCLTKGIDTTGVDVDMDVHDVHGQSSKKPKIRPISSFPWEQS